MSARIAQGKQVCDVDPGRELDREARSVRRRDEADVHHLERADERPAGIEPLSALGMAEGHGEVGAHCAARDLACVGMHAGRQIHRHHPRAGVVEVAQGLGRACDQALEADARAGAEQRVEREVPARARSEQPPQRLLRADLGDTRPLALQAIEMDARLAAHALALPDEPDVDLGAAGAQMARSHEAVAAVVSRATQHNDAQRERRPVATLHGLGHTRACALHQRIARGVPALDRGAIQLAHLGRREEEHGQRATNNTGISTRKRTRAPSLS